MTSGVMGRGLGMAWYRYRAFGLEYSTTGTTDNDFQFVGKPVYFRDPEIDLYLVRKRYYDPSTSQWVSPDPWGFDAGDYNVYRYVGNNPVTRIDPSGLEIFVTGLSSTGDYPSAAELWESIGKKAAALGLPWKKPANRPYGFDVRSYDGDQNLAVILFSKEQLLTVQKVLGSIPVTADPNTEAGGFRRIVGTAGSGTEHFAINWDFNKNAVSQYLTYTPSSAQLEGLRKLRASENIPPAPESLRETFLKYAMPAARTVYGASAQALELAHNAAEGIKEAVSHPIDTVTAKAEDAWRGAQFVWQGLGELKKGLTTGDWTAFKDYGGKAQVWWGQVKDDFEKDPWEFIGRRITDLAANYFGAKGTVQGAQGLVNAAKNLPSAVRSFVRDPVGTVKKTWQKFDEQLDKIGKKPPATEAAPESATTKTPETFRTDVEPPPTSFRSEVSAGQGPPVVSAEILPGEGPVFRRQVGAGIPADAVPTVNPVKNGPSAKQLFGPAQEPIYPADLTERLAAYKQWKAKAGITGTPTSAEFRRFVGAHRPNSRGATLYHDEGGFSSWSRQASSSHGNIAGNQPAWTYKLESGTGEFLKWGVAEDPLTRYTGEFGRNTRITPKSQSPRRIALAEERFLTERFPGPLNFEPWAGTQPLGFIPRNVEAFIRGLLGGE